MNKKIKFISSVALAGVLAINVCNPKTLATTIDEYGSKLKGINGQYAQFVLDDITDRATLNGKVIKTGDKIDIGGTEYTAVVYGDVDGNGRVNGDDAVRIFKSQTGYEGVILTEAQKEAANVQRSNTTNANKVNGTDAINIFKFCTGSQLTEGITFDKDENLTYTITVNDNNTINNVNNSKSKIVLDATNIKNGLTIEATDGTNSISSITINTSSNQTTTQHIQSNVDLHTLTGNSITIEVKDGTTVVGRQIVTNNSTKVPEITNVSTHRDGTEKATLTLESYGDTKVKRVLYSIDPDIDTVSEFLAKGNTVKEIAEVSNGNLVNYPLELTLQENQSYALSYIVENELGNVSNVKTVTISEPNATKATKVENMTVNGATVTWDAISGATFEVVIKDSNNNVVYSDSIANSTNPSIDPSIDISTALASKYLEGTYIVSVAVEGTVSNEKSDPETSAPITVTKLKKLNNVQIEKDTTNNHRKIKAIDSQNSASDVQNYTYNLYTLRNVTNNAGVVTGFEKDPSAIASGSATKAQLEDGVDIESNLSTKNKVYFVEVVANPATGKDTILASESSKSNEIFDLDATSMSISNPTSTAITENTVKLTVSNPITIIGRTVEYKIETYTATANTENGTLAAYNKVGDKRTVNLQNDNTITINGLGQNINYGFIVYACVGDQEVKVPASGYITATTLVAAPTIQGEIAATKADALLANSGKIFVDSSSIVINGVEYTNANIVDYANAMADNVKVIGAFTAKDRITSVSEKTITVDTTNTDKETTIDLANSGTALDYAELTLNIIGDNYKKTITTANTKKLSLSGNGALFDIQNVAATTEIVLNDGVKVNAASTNKLTIAPDATVTINGVVVSSRIGVKLSANSGALTITPNNNANEVLTITNPGNGDITFVATKDARTQLGTINITTNGDVALLTRNADVKANINVTAKNGAEVDLTDAGLYDGIKSITVNKDTSSTVITKYNTSRAIPADLNTYCAANSCAVDYTDDSIKTIIPDNATAISGKTIAERRQEVKTYLDSLGLKNMGATIKTSGNTVTVTFDNTKTVNTSLRDIAK